MFEISRAVVGFNCKKYGKADYGEGGWLGTGHIKPETALSATFRAVVT
jgi:hypothetical protein